MFNVLFLKIANLFSLAIICFINNYRQNINFFIAKTMSTYVRPVEYMRAMWNNRSTGKLQPVDPRSQDIISFSLSPSSCVWPVVNRSNTGRNYFLHSLSPSRCMWPVEDGGFPVVCTPLTGRYPVEYLSRV